MNIEIPELVIRPADISDTSFITELMHVTLMPFYDGDHRAHARRIIAAHLGGGEDTVGHFSFEQRIFVALDKEGNRAGFVNLVGKKQGNYKISPLILDPSFRGTKGFGTLLLEFVERYVQLQGCRQLYCTVAIANTSALNFFLKHGFISGGKAESHYKDGMQEIMLYKRFISAGELIAMDSEHISVRPFDGAHRQEFESLVRTQIAPFFNGVDDRWIQATFDGYERRHGGDINTKYKLMYEAVNHHGQFRGAVALTPKKGQPIKVMPIVAVSPQAFFALLEELPKLSYGFGKKLYAHLVPTTEQVAILQKCGWCIEAMLPGAYNEGATTQQWGLSIKEDVHTLRIKTSYLKLIKSGKKKIEVRVGYDSVKRIKVGDTLTFLTYGDIVSRKVLKISQFESFKELLKSVDANQIVPGKQTEEVHTLLQEIYSPEKESLGVYAFFLQ